MGPHPHPYDGMTEEQLIALGHRIIDIAAGYPPDSIDRAMKLAAYDTVVRELQRRLANHVNAAAGLGLPEL